MGVYRVQKIINIMKRKFFFTASVLMAAFTLTGLTSCSDDDDNGGNGSKNLAYPSPTLVDSNGNKVYVSSIGELERASYSPFWSYTYDDAGNISEFSCIDNFDAIASGSTIVYNYGSGNRTIEIEIGSNGLISKMKEERTEKRWG